MKTADSLPLSPGYHDLQLPFGTAAADADVALSLHLPPQTRQAPLVMVLHYGGPPAGYYGRGLLEQLVVPAWERLGAVCVAPVLQGAEWRSAPNPTVIGALLALLAARYGTAPHARYLVGYSLGAIGCWHWLMDPECPFDAVVPIAGRVPDDLLTFNTPTYALHSHADRLFPSAPLQARFDALRAAGCPLEYRILDGIDHFNVGGYRAALAALLPWLPAAPHGIGQRSSPTP